MKTFANKTYSTYNKVQSIKASKRNWDIIVLVRNGEYYEAYEEDAKKVSDTCGVSMWTRRNCLLDITVFGKDMLDTYLPKLIRKGYKVGITEFNK